MKKISVCTICKNEEHNIEKMLLSVKKYGFEIVVVDTGSSDHTKEIAFKYTDKVFDFEWKDDFSAARNYAASLASNNWILVMDADEWIEEINFEAVEALMNNFPDFAGSIWMNNITGTPQNPGPVSRCHLERLYDRRKYKYISPIHEHLAVKYPSIEFDTLLVGITLGHSGYCLDEEQKQAKAKRNIDLLNKQLLSEPNNPYIYYQLGKGYMLVDDYKNAYTYLSKGLEFDVDERLDFVHDMVISFGKTLLNLGKYEEGLGFQGIYDAFALKADFVYLMGLFYEYNNMLQEAAEEFQKAMQMKDYMQEGVNTYLPCLELGRILIKCGQYCEAVGFLEPLKGIDEAEKLLDVCKENL